MRQHSFFVCLWSLLLTVLAPAYAQDGSLGIGAPTDGALGFQPAATQLSERINGFHDLLLFIIVPTSILVALLLAWVIIRYNRRANPNPQSFSHNTLLEVIWTAGPVLILILIAFPSFPILYSIDRLPTTTIDDFGRERPLVADDWLTIKTYGRQWYWSYIYPDGSDEPVEFDSYLLEGEDLQPGQLRQLSVDYPVVVPVGRYVNLLIAASDVIHSWAIPAFKLKKDAIPGRLNEVWFKVEKPGVYYGQCSELCGARHAYMPIEVRAVSEADYQGWYARAKIDIDEALEYLNQIQPLESFAQQNNGGSSEMLASAHQ